MINTLRDEHDPSAGPTNTVSSGPSPGTVVDKPTTGGPTTVPGATTCSPGSISGVGSSLQQGAVENFVSAYRRSCPAATVAYETMGAGAGRAQFADGKAEFAASEAPINGPQAASAAKRCGGNPVWNIPMVFTPIALAYNVSGVDALILDGPVAAQIFRGRITTWNDPAIAAINPGVTLPSQPIAVVFRSDQTGTTDAFQQYLTASSGGAWNVGAGVDFNGGTGTGVARGTGVAERVASTPGAITYVDTASAAAAKLRLARVNSGSGPVAYSAASAGKAIDASTTALTAPGDLNLNVSTMHGTSAAGAYPLLQPTYEIVCSKGYSAAAGQRVRAFLSSAASDGQSGLEAKGFVPLPSAFRAKVISTVNAIQ
ncbi:hypothetical protein VV02_02155 [Luteipulveratus mongoliensis]|uniref:Phosphate-binding protein n=1 Tax=Luteipulveratus mongoliensis TaxID=571913 RepID=A0A0K1JPQ9_9MICO|nr:hypothetical protein VV02_02155 [Luteipulveratus mongoliensis]